LILFTGGGTSGSWKIRGQQLGTACGAKVKPNASIQDCRKSSVIVGVKRLRDELISTIRQSGRPWVWDIVDAYPQPTCSTWNRAQAIGWVCSRIKLLQPTGIIWPNQRMRDDCDTGLPGLVLPHHYRPDIAVNPIREQVQTVAYEGSPNYIGEWLEPISQACSDRGWGFLINPPSLSEVDIVIACRGKEFNGYAQRHWKSNVKLANAHGSGTPFVGPRECGYLESQTGLEEWADCHDDLDDCFDRLSSQYHRQTVQRVFLDNRYSVTEASRYLMDFLNDLA